MLKYLTFTSGIITSPVIHYTGSGSWRSWCQDIAISCITGIVGHTSYQQTVAISHCTISDAQRRTTCRRNSIITCHKHSICKFNSKLKYFTFTSGIITSPAIHCTGSVSWRSWCQDIAISCITAIDGHTSYQQVVAISHCSISEAQTRTTCSRENRTEHSPP